jgi:hypothetical protein
MTSARFRTLAVRRVSGSPQRCACLSDSGLSATAFSSPAESVVRAASTGHLSREKSYLEVGAGNLRNSFFVQRKFAPQHMVAIEQKSVVDRFTDSYTQFRAAGGTLSHTMPRTRFDVIVVTYVLETICPPIARERLLGEIADRMHSTSSLILSVRGYGGVRGSTYARCSLSDGSRSPRGAFVRAYSIPELEEMLSRHSITFNSLKKYRVTNPENIHGIGKIRND